MKWICDITLVTEAHAELPCLCSKQAYKGKGEQLKATMSAKTGHHFLLPDARTHNQEISDGEEGCDVTCS